MHGEQISLSSNGVVISTPHRLSAVSVARRVLQGVGGGAAVALAAAMPWSEYSPAGATIGAVLVPMAVLVILGLVMLIGLGFFAASVWGLVKRLPLAARVGVIAIAALTGLFLAGLEFGLHRPGTLLTYEYRPAFRLVCYCLGIALLACSVPEELGPRFAYMIRRRHLGLRHILALALAVTAASAIIGAVVLDGMPHIIDGTSYLLEARTLWSGQLTLDPPMHPELFRDELVHFRTTDAGYFSKYPVGWPAVLGLFDAAGVAWLANAVLAGLLVVITYFFVAERSSRHMAGLSAAIVALCPWLWFNAATMMSHLASAVWLWLFLWMMVRGVRKRSHLCMLLSGLALGAAILTRPADAAFFALPCVGAAICWMIRRPSVWCPRLPLIAVGALPGAVAYLMINGRLSVDGGTSPYGGGYSSALLSQTPDSVGHALIWLHQGIVDLSTHWYAGAAPAVLLLLCGIVFGRASLRGQWLVMMCAASFLVCYSVFVFGGRAWVGPRWYVPLLPVGAMLIAAGVDAASRAGRVRSASGVLAAGHLRASLVALVVVFTITLPIRVIELMQFPPHGIDGRVVATVEEAGLTNAVVALPANRQDPDTETSNFKRGIAGMWAMQAPFEESPVIYVVAVDGWQQMAAEAWPGRAQFEMNDTIGDYTLVPQAPINPAAHAER